MLKTTKVQTQHVTPSANNTTPQLKLTNKTHDSPTRKNKLNKVKIANTIEQGNTKNEIKSNSANENVNNNHNTDTTCSITGKKCHTANSTNKQNM